MDSEILSLLSNALAKQSCNEDTSVGKIIADHGARVVRNALGTVDYSDRPLDVSFVLTSEQQALLKAHFPGRSVRFSNKSSSQHSFAAAHRVLETDFVYSFFPEDAVVVDIGGNFSNHVRNRRHNVHSCCPILDVRDGARYTERFMSLTKFMNKHPTEKCEPQYCKNTFQCCELKADYAMAIHSLSDLKLEDLCRAMLSRQIKKTVATIMMTPDMLVDDSGFIPHFEVRWTIDRPNDRIYFDFENASNLGYDHCFSTLMSYMRYNAVRIGNSAFRVERTMDFHGVMVVDITYAENWHPSISSLSGGRSCAWFSKLKNKVVLQLVSNTLLPWAFKKRELVLDKRTISRVMESAFRQYNPDQPVEKAIQNISMLLSSGTNHIVVNGVSVVAGTPLEQEDFVDAATTIYYITKQRYNGLRSKLTAMHNIETKNSSSSVFGEKMATTSLLSKFPLFKQNDLPVDHVLPTLGECVQALVGRDPEVEGDQQLIINKWDEFTGVWADVLCGSIRTNQDMIRKPLEVIPLEEFIQSKIGAFNGVLSIPVEKEFREKQSAINSEALKHKAEEKRMRDAILTIATLIESGNKDLKLPLGISGSSFIPNVVDKTQTTIVEDVTNPHFEAIDECHNYLSTIEENSDRRFKGVMSHIVAGRVPDSVFYGNKDLKAYCPQTATWKTHRDHPDVLEYSVGITPNGKIPVSYDNGKFDSRTLHLMREFQVVLFDQSCVVDNVSMIKSALERSKTMKCDTSITVVDGVAGCGKTTKIVDAVDLNEAGGVLVLTSNKNSALELREKIVGSTIVKARVIRTVDSYLMMSTPFEANKVFIDEGFMQHSGCIYAALTLAKAKECFIFGDTEQIPFISRCPLMRLRHQMIVGSKTVRCLDTHRSPMDATCLLNKLYKQKRPVKTTSKVARSVSVHPISSNQQIPSEPALYLCYTQAEKMDLLSTSHLKGRRVLTVHEAQGESVDNVIFCRLSRTSTDLTSGKHPIMGPCHALVALSRHKKSLKVYSKASTLDMNDILYNLCSEKISERELTQAFTISERLKLDLS
ncbi:methyltransferase-helicase [Tea plant line pattern virus]|uniref:methyltransferase-helicase n=1 Tax=Tea plant line pattern virus TaxID=2419940 RepID=UPI000EB70795|nr:methyltransferase-helicase [Tea plant line pattern virus]AYE53924.1 methyltransferase-helicase [Tea plant line pattern virus]